MISIRARFALLTATLMVILLLVLSVGIHWWMERSLRNEMDARLSRVYQTYRDNPDTIWINPNSAFINPPNPDSIASTGVYIQAFEIDSNGEVERVGRSSNLEGHAIPVPPETIQRNIQSQDAFMEVTIERTRVRAYSAPVFLQDGRLFAIVQVAESLEPLHETLRKLQTILVAGSVLSIVIMTGAVWLIAGTAVRPLKRMTRTAEKIGGADDLSQRIDIPKNDDEIQRLAMTFNAMLDRLEQAFEAQRQFVADASHELRTPLTALRGNADILLKMAEDGEIDRDAFIAGLTDMSGESGRLSRLVQDLLTLARADVGWSPELATVNLTAVANEVARNMTPITGDREFVVQLPDPAASPIWVHGAADQLNQLILILLDNAFTHTPEGTTVRLRLTEDGDEAVIEVADDGPGIAPEHIERIFDRFYRADASRNRSSGGTGLGLSIARWVADIHGGVITASTNGDRGTVFTVRIPVESAPTPEDAGMADRMPGIPTVRAPQS